MATAPAAPATRTIACPACGGTIELRAAGGTMTLACRYCGSLIDVANDDARLIKRFNEAVADLAIPLGRRGTIEGVEWEAIGWLAREEAGVGWEEYLLFNPYHGYRFLVTDGRGWTFVRLLTTIPHPLGIDRSAEGAHYKAFFEAGKARVTRVVGEFYWRVTVGETVETGDWVRPGYMLSREAGDAEETWSLGQLLDARLVRDQFGVPEPAAWPASGRPPLPHQPSPYAGMRKAWKLALAALVALLVLAPIFGRGGTPVTQELTLFPEGTGRSVTLGPVVLTRARQAVTISARAPDVRNQWVDLDYALVNRATQTSYEAYGIAEYYSGRDSDGDWSEGSADPVTKIASVPAGTYDLVVDMGAHNWTGGSGSGVGGFGYTPVRVAVSVAPGGVFWSNVVLAMLLVLGPLIWLTFQYIRFEAARGSQSDFAGSSSDDDSGDDD